MGDILDKLKGGDLRSIGKADEVVVEILKDETLFAEVFQGVFNQEAVVRMRASDVLEKVSRIHPGYLQCVKRQLIEVVSNIEQQEVRWHVAQMLPRLELQANEIVEVLDILIGWLKNSKSNIVKVNSIQALADIAEQHNEYKLFVVRNIEEAMLGTSSAVINRGKKLLEKLNAKW